MVQEPTVDNIQRAKDETLDILFPWPTEINTKQGQSSNVHTVSGSEHHLCLFDRVHECNVKTEEEVLRRITHIRELKRKTQQSKRRAVNKLIKYAGQFWMAAILNFAFDDVLCINFYLYFAQQ
jgi:hypothetical protein